jgi:pilus assembly protein Flp/PilA
MAGAARPPIINRPTSEQVTTLVRAIIEGDSRNRILTMRRLLKRFFRDNSAATAVEYGLIAGLIGVVIISALTTAGVKVSAKFQKVGTALT